MIIIDNIIEKTLGEGEKMVLLKEAIIGFSMGVKIRNCRKEMGFSQSQYVTIEGPGFLVIETGAENDSLMGRFMNRRD
jgi:hypothetical protein